MQCLQATLLLNKTRAKKSASEAKLQASGSKTITLEKKTKANY